MLELMVGVVIISVVSLAIVPRVIDRPDQARRERAASDLAVLTNAVALYSLDNQTVPTTDQGLLALTERPTVAPAAPNGTRYVDRLPKDPWGNDYLYLPPRNTWRFRYFQLRWGRKECRHRELARDLNHPCRKHVAGAQFGSRRAPVKSLFSESAHRGGRANRKSVPDAGEPENTPPRQSWPCFCAKVAGAHRPEVPVFDRVAAMTLETYAAQHGWKTGFAAPSLPDKPHQGLRVTLTHSDFETINITVNFR